MTAAGGRLEQIRAQTVRHLVEANIIAGESCVRPTVQGNDIVLTVAEAVTMEDAMAELLSLCC